jgi:hypothetical protein
MRYNNNSSSSFADTNLRYTTVNNANALAFDKIQWQSEDEVQQYFSSNKPFSFHYFRYTTNGGNEEWMVTDNRTERNIFNPRSMKRSDIEQQHGVLKECFNQYISAVAKAHNAQRIQLESSWASRQSTQHGLMPSIR